MRLERGKGFIKDATSYASKAKHTIALRAAANAWRLGVPWAEALHISTNAMETSSAKPTLASRGKKWGDQTNWYLMCQLDLDDALKWNVGRQKGVSTWHQPFIIRTFAKNAIELQVQKQRNYTKLNVSMIQVVIHQRSFLEWFQRALVASILHVCIFSDILAFFRWVSGRFAVGSWKLDVIAFFCHWIVPFQFQSFKSTTLLFLELFSICQVWQRHYFDCF